MVQWFREKKKGVGEGEGGERGGVAAANAQLRRDDKDWEEDISKDVMRIKMKSVEDNWRLIDGYRNKKDNLLADRDGRQEELLDLHIVNNASSTVLHVCLQMWLNTGLLHVIWQEANVQRESL